MITKFASLINYSQVIWGKIYKSQFLKEFVVYSVSSFAYQCSRFILLIIIAKIIGPKQFGFWNLINLILIYRGITHLGIIPAANREIPFYRGKNDLRKVEEIRSVSFTYSLIFTMAFSMLMLSVSLFINDKFIRFSCQLMAILYLFTQMYHYFQVYLKSGRLFGLMSLQQLFFAILLPVITIPLTLKYKLTGFIIGQAISIAILLVFIIKKTSFCLTLNFNKNEGVRLIRIGFPIMIAAFFYGLFTTVDRWIITSFLSVEDLGYYSLSIIVMGSISLFPRALAEQIYPRMAEIFGSTSNYLSLLKWKLRQIAISLSVTIPIILVFFFIAPVIVRSLLPDYIPGILPMKIILVGILFLPIADSFGNFLLVINRQTTYMYIHAFFVIFNTILGIYLVRTKLALNGIALSSTITYFIYSVVLGVFSLKFLFNQKGVDRGESCAS